MKFDTTRFGTLEAEESSLIEFDRGLFGYEEIDRSVLVDPQRDTPLKWLQAVSKPDLAFVVIDPFLFCPAYHVELSNGDRTVLDPGRDADLVVLAIVGIPENPHDMTANLKGPIVVNPVSRVGRQVILESDRWSPRVRILDAIRRLNSESGRGEQRRC